MKHSHEITNSRSRNLHKDWRLWITVGLMLLAMLMYLLTLDESIDPAVPPAGQSAATNLPAQQ